MNIHLGVKLALVALFLLLTVRFGGMFGFPPSGISTFWPANALLFVILLCLSRHVWKLYLSVSWVAYFFAELWIGFPPLNSFIFSTANCMEAALAAYVVQRYSSAPYNFSSAWQVSLILGLAALGSAVAGTIGALTISLTVPGQPFLSIFQKWAIADFVGFLIVCPLLLSIVEKQYRQIQLSSSLTKLEGGILLGLLSVVSFLLFGEDNPQARSFNILYYLPIPLLFWAALRFGQFGTALSSCLVSLLAIIFAINGRGVFTLLTPEENVQALQVFVTIIVVSLLFFSALLREREAVQNELLRAHNQLDQKVKERTNELETVNVRLQQEIQEREYAQQELNQQKELLQTIFDHIPVMVGIFDQTGRVILANKRMESRLGWSQEELKTLNLIESCYPDPNYRKKVLHHMLYGVSTWKDFKTTTRLGKVIDTTWANVKLADGISIGIGQDITERKQLEEQLRQSQKMEALGTLAGGIAHDFNNILAAILANAEIGWMDFPQNQKAQRYFEAITKSAERASELVKQILVFSRMDPLTFRPINLASVVQDTVKMLRATIPHHIEITLDLSEHCPNILADATQMHQVLLNLCSNSYHAMEENGGRLEIALEAARGGTYLKLTIQDTGHGMDAEAQRRVFDPFFTTKEVGKGTGLGLSVVHGIVEKHRGEITIDSQMGQGTTVSIWFPTTQAKASTTPPKQSVLKKGSAHILIVEDEPLIADSYRKILERQGYLTTVCRNGVEALAEFEKNPNHIDLVLTDQAMPQMTGKQLAFKLLAIRPNLPILLSTGYSDIITKEEAQTMGIRRYLAKPIRLRTLLEVIADCLKST